jgi:hypothetical protein
VFGPPQPGKNLAVERGSDKQSPRVDDELKHESESFERGAPVESRVEEHRIAEEAAPDPDPAAVLPGSTFPADRAAILEAARLGGASQAALRELELLPDGETFRTADDVRRRLGGTQG